ncbi:hypothetical protein HKX48_004464 [Thoreauomyces humboldtii]|nr:hypothetical protein HKX48_004464 [Thoreauomyces humboldtii]
MSLTMDRTALTAFAVLAQEYIRSLLPGAKGVGLTEAECAAAPTFHDVAGMLPEPRSSLLSFSQADADASLHPKAVVKPPMGSKNKRKRFELDRNAVSGLGETSGSDADCDA